MSRVAAVRRGRADHQRFVSPHASDTDRDRSPGHAAHVAPRGSGALWVLFLEPEGDGGDGPHHPCATCTPPRRADPSPTAPRGGHDCVRWRGRSDRLCFQAHGRHAAPGRMSLAQPGEDTEERSSAPSHGRTVGVPGTPGAPPNGKRHEQNAHRWQSY